MQNSVLVLYNPNAKKGKIKNILPHLEERLLTKYRTCTMIGSKSAQDLEDLARKNADKYNLIIVCGGDGSIHNAINGVKKSGASPTMAFLPYGTVNDVCSSLKMSKNLDKSINIILRGKTKDYDVIKDKDNYIMYTLAGGIFVCTSFKTNAKLKRVFGKFAYFLRGAREIFHLKSLPMTIEADRESFHSNYLLTMILNSKSVAGFKCNKDSILDDGKMDIILVEGKKNKLGAIFTLAKIFLFGVKSVKNSKHIIFRQAKSVHIENHSNEIFTQDGESCEFLKKDLVVDTPIKVIYN